MKRVFAFGLILGFGLSAVRAQQDTTEVVGNTQVQVYPGFNFGISIF